MQLTIMLHLVHAMPRQRTGKPNMRAAVSIVWGQDHRVRGTRRRVTVGAGDSDLHKMSLPHQLAAVQHIRISRPNRKVQAALMAGGCGEPENLRQRAPLPAPLFRYQKIRLRISRYPL